MFDLRYITRKRYAYGVLDGRFVILTGYRCDRKTDAFVFTSKIRLSVSQATGIETCAPLFRPQVIAGFVDMFGRYAAGEVDCFTFPNAPDLHEDDFCPRCGEAPRAVGDTVCANCRAELKAGQAPPPGTTPPAITEPPRQRYIIPICPICGNKVVDECRCGKYGAVICRKHCYKPAGCRHLDSRISIEYCRYPRYIENGILKTGKEVSA